MTEHTNDDGRLGLDADQVLTTTRSVRKRLDFEREVSRDTVMRALDIALQAPTGSNRQGWQWVFVDDEDKKAELTRIYADNFALYRSLPRPNYDADDPRALAADRVVDSAQYLADNFARSPILMIPCIEGKPETSGSSAAFWGSLLPAVWSFMLALRERGLGSAWTTLHLINGGEEQAADLLGIPFDRYSQGGLFPIAHTIGTEFRPASRLPARDLTHWNSWGTRPD
ncbi:MAG: nitroreductase family protein [Ilumatobacteraceae bacterium]